MFKFTLFEDFRCPLCEDLGIVRVPVEPPFGSASGDGGARTQWRACECRRYETLAAEGRDDVRSHP